MFSASGIGTYISNILPKIISLCPDITFNLLGDKLSLQKLAWASSPNVYLIDCISPIYSINEQIELFRKVPASDILWAPHYNIPVLPVRVKKRIVTVHDVYHLAFIDRLPLMQKSYARIMLKAAVEKSDRVITVSNFSKEEIIKFTRADRNKIKVLYNGINTDIFKPLGEESILI